MVTLHLCKLLPNLYLWPLYRHSGVFVMANQSRYSYVGEGSCECYFWVWLQLYMQILTVGKALSHNIKIMYVRTLKHNRFSNTIMSIHNIHTYFLSCSVQCAWCISITENCPNSVTQCFRVYTPTRACSQKFLLIL